MLFLAIICLRYSLIKRLMRHFVTILKFLITNGLASVPGMFYYFYFTN